MAKKQPPFKNEAEEAAWWAKNQNLIADRFDQAKAAGHLGKGTVARLARERANQAGASPTITIRIATDDLTRARILAAQKGLRYQTYLKMLLHQALNSEEKKTATRLVVEPLRSARKRKLEDSVKRVMKEHENTFRRLAK